MPTHRKPARAESPCSATAMRKASRRLTQLYDDALEPSGLRSTQFAILAELDRRSSEPPTMRVLADALVMDWSALGIICARSSGTSSSPLTRAARIAAGATWS
jgi:hypothetical protein